MSTKAQRNNIKILSLDWHLFVDFSISGWVLISESTLGSSGIDTADFNHDGTLQVLSAMNKRGALFLQSTVLRNYSVFEGDTRAWDETATATGLQYLLQKKGSEKNNNPLRIDSTGFVHVDSVPFYSDSENANKYLATMTVKNIYSTLYRLIQLIVRPDDEDDDEDGILDLIKRVYLS